jgi:hypothetical protein
MLIARSGDGGTCANEAYRISFDTHFKVINFGESARAKFMGQHMCVTRTANISDRKHIYKWSYLRSWSPLIELVHYGQVHAISCTSWFLHNFQAYGVQLGDEVGNRFSLSPYPWCRKLLPDHIQHAILCHVLQRKQLECDVYARDGVVTTSQSNSYCKPK